MANVTGNKNTHMTHIEDLIWDGQGGIDKLSEFLAEIYHSLEGNNTHKINIKAKWDGAPAVFCASDFYGRKFVAKKGLMNKTPQYATTPEEADACWGSIPDLCEKMKLLLSRLDDIKIPKDQFWQGDFLFSQKDLLNVKVKGEECVAFRPNTILYSIPKSDPLADKLLHSEFGVAFHTRYTMKGNFTDMSSIKDGIQATYDVSVDEINTPENLFLVDARIPVVDNNSFTSEEEASITQKLETIKKASDALISSPDYQEFLNSKLLVLWETFTNQLIRDGKQFVDGYVDSFRDWMKARLDENIASKKTEKTKIKLQAQRDSILNFINDKKAFLELSLALQKAIVTLKDTYLSKLRNLKSSYKSYVELKDGQYVPTSGEGYAISDSFGNVVKLVSRLEFSRNNFSDQIVKGWQKKESIKSNNKKLLKEDLPVESSLDLNAIASSLFAGQVDGVINVIEEARENHQNSTLLSAAKSSAESLKGYAPYKTVVSQKSIQDLLSKYWFFVIPTQGITNNYTGAFSSWIENSYTDKINKTQSLDTKKSLARQLSSYVSYITLYGRVFDLIFDILTNLQQYLRENKLQEFSESEIDTVKKEDVDKYPRWTPENADEQSVIYTSQELIEFIKHLITTNDTLKPNSAIMRLIKSYLKDHDRDSEDPEELAKTVLACMKIDDDVLNEIDDFNQEKGEGAFVANYHQPGKLAVRRDFGLELRNKDNGFFREMLDFLLDKNCALFANQLHNASFGSSASSTDYEVLIANAYNTIIEFLKKNVDNGLIDLENLTRENLIELGKSKAVTKGHNIEINAFKIATNVLIDVYFAKDNQTLDKVALTSTLYKLKNQDTVSQSWNTIGTKKDNTPKTDLVLADAENPSRRKFSLKDESQGYQLMSGRAGEFVSTVNAAVEETAGGDIDENNINAKAKDFSVEDSSSGETVTLYDICLNFVGVSKKVRDVVENIPREISATNTISDFKKLEDPKYEEAIEILSNASGSIKNLAEDFTRILNNNPLLKKNFFLEASVGKFKFGGDRLSSADAMLIFNKDEGTSVILEPEDYVEKEQDNIKNIMNFKSSGSVKSSSLVYRAEAGAGDLSKNVNHAQGAGK